MTTPNSARHASLGWVTVTGQRNVTRSARNGVTVTFSLKGVTVTRNGPDGPPSDGVTCSPPRAARRRDLACSPFPRCSQLFRGTAEQPGDRSRGGDQHGVAAPCSSFAGGFEGVDWYLTAARHSRAVDRRTSGSHRQRAKPSSCAATWHTNVCELSLNVPRGPTVVRGAKVAKLAVSGPAIRHEIFPADTRTTKGGGHDSP